MHLREIYRHLDRSEGVIKYHLITLEKKGLINVISEKGYTRYYVSNRFGRDEEIFIGFLRQKVPRQILLYLSISFAASQIEISKDLEKHPATISFHLKRMIEKGVVIKVENKNGLIPVEADNKFFAESRVNGKEVLFKLKNPKIMYNLMKSGLHKYINYSYTKDAYEYLKSGESNLKYRKTLRTAINDFELGFYKIFPHPYHA